MRLKYPFRETYPITGTFGPRESFQLPNGQWTLPFHYGVDFGAPQGTPILATHDGVVGFSGWDNTPYGGGNMVQILGGEWSTWYLHMRDPARVRAGVHVRAGDVIGYVGSTGASTGAHLHLELQRNGTAVDPLAYMYDEDDPVDNRPVSPHPVIKNDEDEEMKLWIADVKGTWYLVVPTGSGKPNTVVLPGNSGMGGGGAANAGIPVIRLTTVTELRKVANA